MGPLRDACVSPVASPGRYVPRAVKAIGGDHRRHQDEAAIRETRHSPALNVEAHCRQKGRAAYEGKEVSETNAARQRVDSW